MTGTEIPLARPEPVSLDAGVALLGAGLAGSGISALIGFAWGLSTQISIAFVAIGLPLLFAQRRLAYHREGSTLRVDVLTGSRELDLTEVTQARVVDGWLALGLLRVSLPAYHTGRFHLPGEGGVLAYASRVRGPFVLLERGSGRPWLISPREPEAFVETVLGSASNGDR